MNGVLPRLLGFGMSMSRWNIFIFFLPVEFKVVYTTVVLISGYFSGSALGVFSAFLCGLAFLFYDTFGYKAFAIMLGWIYSVRLMGRKFGPLQPFKCSAYSCLRSLSWFHSELFASVSCMRDCGREKSMRISPSDA